MTHFTHTEIMVNWIRCQNSCKTHLNIPVAKIMTKYSNKLHYPYLYLEKIHPFFERWPINSVIRRWGFLVNMIIPSHHDKYFVHITTRIKARPSLTIQERRLRLRYLQMRKGKVLSYQIKVGIWPCRNGQIS